MTTQTRLEGIAEAIMDESERQVIERLGYVPEPWYYGGSAHNDYRLTASIRDGEIRVSDGAAYDTYRGDGTDEDIKSYVSDWPDTTMPEAAQS